MFISFKWRGMFPELSMNIITSYLTLYIHGLRNWETSLIKTMTDRRDWITGFNNHPSNICISNLFRSYWFVCLLFLGNTDPKAWSQARTSPFEVPSGLGRGHGAQRHGGSSREVDTCSGSSLGQLRSGPSRPPAAWVRHLIRRHPIDHQLRLRCPWRQAGLWAFLLQMSYTSIITR